ncbi:pectinesterase family protein [Sphingobacterium gobiense]|uniref:Pectinesterase n=1 Tax=Sphingobacterium gobiense TaxID=1382456 RepID=A0A2S9JKU4_9SPHI|nr:pectinesterase family protein [Sphingobacterium gobiense]PRD53738.1 pectin esterase [Sphingobacterium gobiense]
MLKTKRYIRKIHVTTSVFALIVGLIFISCLSDAGITGDSSGGDEGNVIKTDVVVAADGTGDYKTVQEAIDAAPDNAQEPYYIYVKSGIYKEVITVPRNKNHIYLVGEEATTTVLTYDNYASRIKPDGSEYGTSGSASFFVQGNNFVAENITFENNAGIKAGQALAINISGAYSSFRNCRFLGHQDTWYAGNGTYQYLKDCYIEGSVDFIFGGSTAYFDNCQLESTRDGYITAASTPEDQAYGYVFHQCTLTARSEIAKSSVYLGRPWRPNAQVVFIDCTMDKHIQQPGWHNWGKPDNEKTAYYAEFNSRGEGASPETRVSWSRQLPAEEAVKFRYDKVIGGKHPALIAEGYKLGY